MTIISMVGTVPVFEKRNCSDKTTYFNWKLNEARKHGMETWFQLLIRLLCLNSVIKLIKPVLPWSQYPALWFEEYSEIEFKTKPKAIVSVGNKRGQRAKCPQEKSECTLKLFPRGKNCPQDFDHFYFHSFYFISISHIKHLKKRSAATITKIKRQRRSREHTQTQ